MPSKTEELILAIVRAARVSPAGTPELRDAIYEYVHGLRAGGHSPEQAVIAVKALIAEAGIERRRATTESPGARLASRIVAWAIDAYFPRTPGVSEDDTRP